MDKENVSRDTRLLYCTTGMFKKMIIGKKSLSEWTHIILDEVHEREMDLDFALMLCKQVTLNQINKIYLKNKPFCVAPQRFLVNDMYKTWPGPSFRSQ